MINIVLSDQNEEKLDGKGTVVDLSSDYRVAFWFTTIKDQIQGRLLSNAELSMFIFLKFIIFIYGFSTLRIFSSKTMKEH